MSWDLPLVPILDEVLHSGSHLLNLLESRLEPLMLVNYPKVCKATNKDISSFSGEDCKIP